MKDIELRTVLESKGLLHYEQASRSYSILRFKAKVLDFFGMQKRRDKKYSYKLEVFGRDYQSFKERIKVLEEESRMVPIMLYLYEEERESKT